MTVEGERRWVEFETLAFDESDFEILGCDFDEAHPSFVHPLGAAHLRCFPQRLLVDFAVAWMERRRNA
jgi:aminoglycoside 3-N-acetyltransferase